MLNASSIDGRALAVLRQQPVAEGEEDDARDGDARAPTGGKSNMLNGSPSNSSRTRDTMMLGEVPIRVTMPPSSEPKAIGIRKRDGEVLVRRAIWKATGIIIASAPMFLTKAESTVTTPTSTMI